MHYHSRHPIGMSVGYAKTLAQRKKSMKYTFFLLGLIFSSCLSKAQDGGTANQGNEIKIQNSRLIAIGDIDLEPFEILYEDLFILEDFGINLDSLTKDHLVCFAIDQCDKDLLSYLIEQGANVNSKCDGDDAITYVTYCIDAGVDLTRILLANGADKNGVDQDDESFLSYAISYDNHKLVEYLIEIGADKKHRDKNPNLGCLPIHGCESLEMLKLLIDNGFEINSICDNGRNLLHFAAKDNLPEIAEYLIDHKLVDIHLKDSNGETPLDYAARFGNSEIENIIKGRK